MNWISVKDHLPTKDIEYCSVTIDCFGVSRYIKTVSYTKDLSKVDEWDFPADEYKGVSGFYDNDSEWSYYEVSNVLAWCEVEPYEGE
jgi:hypothetical protein